MNLKRYERKLACQYSRGVMQRRCRRFCLRCIWDLIEGSTRRSRARTQAFFDTIDACPHESRRPNTKALDPAAEICNDCGVGLIRWSRRKV